MATETFEAESFAETVRKLLPLPIIQFETNLVDHCNLNCKSCDHISPLAEPWYADPAAFEKDMDRMAELFDSRARYVRLVGGEPLLHPDLPAFFRIARQCFPGASVEVWTNAVLLPEMDERFWSACRQLDILINVTKYPIALDYPGIAALAAQKGVRLKFFGRGVTVDAFNNNSFDLRGRFDPRASFLACPNANRHITLVQGGALFTCDKPPHVSVLNRRFGTPLEITERDHINIHADVTAEEIFRFLARPIPFCRYCDIRARGREEAWDISQRQIGEWVAGAGCSDDGHSGDGV